MKPKAICSKCQHEETMHSAGYHSISKGVGWDIVMCCQCNCCRDARNTQTQLTFGFEEGDKCGSEKD